MARGAEPSQLEARQGLIASLGGESGSGAFVVDEAFREVRASLREQAARHVSEQEALLERLLGSVGEKLALATDGHFFDAEDSSTEGPYEVLAEGNRGCDAPHFAYKEPYHSSRPLDKKAQAPEIEVLGGDGGEAAASAGRESSRAQRSDSSSIQPHLIPQVVDFNMGAKASRLSDTGVYQAKAFNAVDPIGAMNGSSVFMRLDRALTEKVEQGGIDGRISRCTASLLLSLRRLAAMREPVRTGCFARLVVSKIFHACCTVCILLNTVFLMYTTDYEMRHTRDDSLPAVSDTITIIESLFVSFYVVELTMKLCVHRLYLFWCPDAAWNVFDILLVSISMVEMVFTVVTQESIGTNVTALRAFRLFRIAKVLRIFRSVRMFSELRLMFDCVLGSMVSLMWCLIMITLIIFVFALFIVQNIAQDISLDDCPGDTQHVQDIHLYFGSVGQAMMTLTQSTTNGQNWGEILDVLNVGHVYAAWSFVAFIVFFALAAWNIVTSLFIEKALKFAKPDLDTLAMEHNMSDAKDARELASMFSAVDTDGSGTISMQEMNKIMKNQRFRSYLRARDIDIADAEFFYKMLLCIAGDSDPEIEIHFVVAACLRMKGNATSMDLHALSFESKLISRRLRHHIGDSAERLQRIESAMEALTRSALARTEAEGSGYQRARLFPTSAASGIAASLAGSKSAFSPAISLSPDDVRISAVSASEKPKRPEVKKLAL